MRLSAKLIKNFVDINHFNYATEWNARQNEPNTFYFQLVDLDQDGLRYLPIDASYSVTVTFPALNVTNVLEKSATQASALDRSVWKVDLADTEVPSSGNVQFKLVEGSVTRRFSVLQALVVEKLNDGGC